MENSEIKNKLAIYSPVDGLIYPINKLDDGVFSAKTLGDGVYIIPENNTFYSPLASAKVALIAKTKHAICFSNAEVSLLMHIGLETTTLDGVPFDIKVNIGDAVDLNSHICDVDLQVVIDKKLTTATPLVIDPSSKFTGFELVDKFVNDHEVKRGELIGYAIALTKENTAHSQPKKLNIDTIVDYVSPQKQAAQNIYKAVGGHENFSDVTHCMTRLRLTIKNKKIVDESSIKKISCVKDIHWNGPQIQIIIGSEVGKVYDEFNEIIKATPSTTNQNAVNYTNTGEKLGVDKIPWSKRIFAAISGVIFPIFPAIMIVGVLKAFYVILSMPQLGILTDINGQMTSSTTDTISAKYVISYIIYVISDIPLLFFGFFFFVSVVKYMKGNVFVAIVIGLILCAPVIYTTYTPYKAISEAFVFPYFKLPQITFSDPYVVLEQPVGIVNMSQNIFMMSAAGVFFVYFDKWVKSWMPNSVSFLLQAAVSVVGTVIAGFTVIGIVMSVVNYAIAIIFISFSAIPYGIGLGLFAIIWQPLVVTGTHMGFALLATLQLLQANPIPSSFLLGAQYAAFAECGVGLAIASRTKDMNLRSRALSNIPLTIIGVTEPIMYGLILPKRRLFILGCIASGIAGFITGYFGANICSIAGAQGLLVIPGLIPTGSHQDVIDVNSNVGFGVLGLVLALVIAYGLACWFYADFKSTKKQTDTIEKLIKHHYKLALTKHYELNADTWTKVKTGLNQLKVMVDNEETVKIFAKRLNNLSTITRLETALTKINNKETKVKAKLAKKAAFYTKKAKQAKVTLINKQIQSINFDCIRKPLLERHKKINQEAETIKNELDTFKEKYMASANQIINDATQCFHDQKLTALTINYQNAFNAIDIAFNVAEALPNAFTITKNKK